MDVDFLSVHMRVKQLGRRDSEREPIRVGEEKTTNVRSVERSGIDTWNGRHRCWSLVVEVVK
ncbi:hypothetical protein K523DRAFT_325841 [Schizophyllum commune Tattone D]|nr:hypothetical protein K523DRAFT_325841 [Schizophyllum commune Tattone D]